MQKLVSICQKTIENSFYILLFFTPFIFSSWNSELFELPKMYFTIVLTTIITGAWLTRSVLVSKFIFKRTVLDIPLILFLLSQVISTYLSIDQHTSIWGYYSRMNGGLVSIISYLLLYWGFVSNMDKEKTLLSMRFLLTSALLISLYAILEKAGMSLSCVFLKGEFNTDCWVQKVQERVFASLGQPNWLSAWLVAIAPLSWSYFLLNTKNKNFLSQATNYLLPSTMFAAILFTNSRSGLLGLGIAFVFFFSLITYHYSLLTIRPFLLLTTVYILLAAIFGTPWTPSINSLLLPQTTNYQLPTTTLPGGTESGEIRKIVWQGAVNIWHSYPIFGTGPETFAYSYWWFRPVEHNLTSEWDLLYNKAHNEYLNYLANTGTVGFIGYILPILVFLVWTTMKLSSQKLQIDETTHTTNYILQTTLLAGFVSILVTNFFGFSTVNLALLYYLFPAFAVTLLSEEQSVFDGTKNTKQNIIIWSLISMLFALCFMLYILWRLATFFHADLLYSQSEKLSDKDLDGEAILKARDAISLRGNEPLYYDRLAISASFVAIGFQEINDEIKATDIAGLATDSTLYATRLSPYHLTLLKSQSVIFTRLTSIDESYLAMAIHSLEQAVRLAPTDPKVHYNLGVLYERNGEVQKAKDLLEKAVELKPNYYDARIGLAKIYETLGERKKARGQLEFILNNIDQNDQKAKDALEKLPTLK